MVSMADLMVRPNGGSRGLVNDFLGFDPFRVFSGGGYGYGVEVQRTETGWTVELPVPGYKPEQLEVTVEDRVLTVSGKGERRSFQRSLLIPEEVDADAIEAKIENGLLTLTLQLHPKAQPRKIAVNVVN
jgi:HSP20 family protein